MTEGANTAYTRLRACGMELAHALSPAEHFLQVRRFPYTLGGSW